MKTQFPDLESVYLFTRVAELGSFAAVSRTHRLSKPSLSRKIAQLEEDIGAQLLVRTTRSVRLTHEGREFLRNAQTVLTVVEDAKAKAIQSRQEPEGKLRITAGVEFGLAVMMPLLESFCSKYPLIQAEIDLTGRMVDLVNEGFDIGIRIGDLEDSSLTARKIGAFSYGLFASPRLLKGRIPKSIDQLKALPALCFSRGEHRDVWELMNGVKSVSISIEPRLWSNHHGALKSAAIRGLGVAFMPEFLAKDAVQLGELVRVLPSWGSPPLPVHAVYPSQRYPSRRVRVFLDFVAANFRWS